MANNGSGESSPVDEKTGEIEVFHNNKDCKNFEDLGQDNGFRFWYATDLARCLDYEDFGSFRKGPLNKAIAACTNLGIPVEENFLAVKRVVSGREIADMKLSRFGCHLAAMNGDTKKPKVSQAQGYFAVMAESFRQYLEEAKDIERLNIRDEITGRERALGSVAKGAGVVDYALFQNAGYRGLYNMNLRQLKEHKGIPDAKRSLLDFMGTTELAANLFRLTQTDEKIRNDGIRGQKPCENAAEQVGKVVHQTVQRISGTRPESLPLEGDITDTRKNLKHASKGFKKLDGKKAPKPLPPE